MKLNHFTHQAIKQITRVPSRYHPVIFSGVALIAAQVAAVSALPLVCGATLFSSLTCASNQMFRDKQTFINSKGDPIFINKGKILISVLMGAVLSTAFVFSFCPLFLSLLPISRLILMILMNLFTSFYNNVVSLE